MTRADPTLRSSHSLLALAARKELKVTYPSIKSLYNLPLHQLSCHQQLPLQHSNTTHQFHQNV
jgi:hypothetical protein